MEKLLLLITLISFSLLSCKKEKSINTENSHSENQSLTRRSSYNHIIFNCAGNNYYSTSYILPASNTDKALIWEETYGYNPSQGWAIEYLNNGFVKFWWQGGKPGEKWRLLDIDWRNPKDSIINSVLWPSNGHPNQEWDLIGSKYITSEGIEDFVGVIVNRRNGRMLRLRFDYNDPQWYKYAIVRELYEGSDEEKYYIEHGNFQGYCATSLNTTVWHIQKF